MPEIRGIWFDRLRTLLLLSGFVSIGVLALNVRSYRSGVAQARDRAHAADSARVGELATSLAASLDSTARAVRNAASRLNGAPLPSDADLYALLDTLLEDLPSMTAVGLALEPHFPGAPPGFMTAYVRRGEEGVERLRPDEVVDSALYHADWYVGAMFDDTAQWSEPAWDPVEGMTDVRYAVPVDLQGGEEPGWALGRPDGVLFATLELSEVAGQVAALELEGTGYGFLFSRDGIFIHHPRRDYRVRREVDESGRVSEVPRTVFDVAWRRGDAALHALGVESVNGHWADTPYMDPLSGPAWLMHHPVEGPGWTLAATVQATDTDGQSNVRRRELLRIMLWGLLSVLLLGWAALLSVLANRGALLHLANVARRATDRHLWAEIPGLTDRHILWAGSILFSVLAILGIASVWVMVQHYPISEDGDRHRILHPVELNQFLQAASFGALGQTKPLPTGVFVQSIEFQSGVDVKVSGIIWQRYDSVEHRGLREAIYLPEATSADIEELYREEGVDETLVGWSFTALLRQEFSYRRFPLDLQDVWVRVEHPDLNASVLIVPDLEAYPITNPSALPGVDQDMVLPGWNVHESYFDYRPISSTATFGGDALSTDTERQAMFFNVRMQRRFLEPFIANVIPLALAVAMLFLMLLIARRDTEDNDLRGYSVMSVIGGAAALFFVVVFQHIAIRTAVPTPGVIYLEHYYFAMYVELLAVTISAIVVASSGVTARMVRAEDHLLPKLLFWPTYLGYVLLVTVRTFYA